MSKTTISMRLEEGLLSKADSAVEAGRYASRTDVIERGLDFELNLDPAVRQLIKHYADALRIVPLEFVEGVVSMWHAQQVAYRRAWRRDDPRPLIEFVRYERGPSCGETRIAMLIENLTREFEQRRRDTLRRIAREHGVEALNPVDRKFLTDNPPKAYVEPNTSGFTFAWAGEEPRTLDEMDK